MQEGKFLLLFFLLLPGISAPGQAFLVLETSGKVKPRKYPAGSQIRVHFKGEAISVWDTYTIKGFDLSAQCIVVSESYCLPLKDLDGFDVSPGKGGALASTMRKFFIQWSFFSLAQYIFKPPLYPFHFAVAGGTALAWLYSSLFLKGEKKLNTRHRLRLIDLSLEQPRA